jgi:hypothetical protein
LQRPPRVLDRPLRPCPSETLRLVITSPISLSISASNLRARELLLAPRSWSLSAPSGLGLSHARGCKPVEYRPLARVIAVCCALHHLGLVGSHSHALALTLSLGPRCLVCRHCSFLCSVNHIGVSPSVACTQDLRFISLVTLSFSVFSITRILITFAVGRSVSVSLSLIQSHNRALSIS